VNEIEESDEEEEEEEEEKDDQPSSSITNQPSNIKSTNQNQKNVKSVSLPSSSNKKKDDNLPPPPSDDLISPSTTMSPFWIILFGIGIASAVGLMINKFIIRK